MTKKDTPQVTKLEHLDGKFIERSISKGEKKAANSAKASKNAGFLLDTLTDTDDCAHSFPEIKVSNKKKRRPSDSSASSLSLANATDSQRKVKNAKRVARRSIRDNKSKKMNGSKMFNKAMGGSAACTVS